jgi:hypothetical protein
MWLFQNGMETRKNKDRPTNAIANAGLRER